MLPSGLIPRGVAREVVRCDAELTGDIAQHGLGDRFRRCPGAARVAQEAELDREAQTVLVAPTLGDQIQIRRRERVALGDLPSVGRQHQELSVLPGREDFLSRHGCSCGIGDCTAWRETIVFRHATIACPGPRKDGEFRGSAAGGFSPGGGGGPRGPVCPRLDP